MEGSVRIPSSGGLLGGGGLGGLSPLGFGPYSYQKPREGVRVTSWISPVREGSSFGL